MKAASSVVLLVALRVDSSAKWVGLTADWWAAVKVVWTADPWAVYWADQKAGWSERLAAGSAEHWGCYWVDLSVWHSDVEWV